MGQRGLVAEKDRSGLKSFLSFFVKLGSKSKSATAVEPIIAISARTKFSITAANILGNVLIFEIRRGHPCSCIGDYPYKLTIQSVLQDPVPGARGVWYRLVTRVTLKIPNTSEQTVFAHDSEHIDVVMDAERLGSKFRQFFAIEPVTS